MDDYSDESCNLRNLYELFLEYDEALENCDDDYCEDEEDDLYDYDEENFFENERYFEDNLCYIIDEEVEDYPEFDDYD